MNITGKKWGIAKKHNGQILEHNRHKPTTKKDSLWQAAVFMITQWLSHSSHCTDYIATQGSETKLAHTIHNNGYHAHPQNLSMKILLSKVLINDN